MSAENLGHFTLSVPIPPKETDYVGAKSALFIPTENVVNSGFESSLVNPGIMVTRDAEILLSSIDEQSRNFGSRNTAEAWGPLEMDPSRQQLIVYSLITSGDSMLLYRRASSGETRLSGNASVGFGGHTEAKDALEIGIFHELTEGSGEFIETERQDGSMRQAIDRELEEELGLRSDDVDLKVIGAFYEKFSEEELSDKNKIPVGSVHTCIIAAARISPDVAMITLQRDEIAEASWVKISDISNVLQALIEQGVGVDNWTHIAVSEFEDVLKTFDGEAVDLPEIVID